jgi:hypothetical protein
MKITNGKIISSIAVIHTAFTLSPIAYIKQFENFSSLYFFRINVWISGTAFQSRQMNYENFAAFWCFYFGLLMFPLGILLDSIEKTQAGIPKQFIWSYFIFIIIGIYMIPVSGMTVFMLPHAIYMIIKSRKNA